MENAAFEHFPSWLRITHFLNFFFLTLLVRSGIQILSDHPKLYWQDHCLPGSEWLKFGKRKMPEDGLWTSMDEADEINPVIALPGKRHALGVARHWHFLCVAFWLLNGLAYIVLLFATGSWQRLVPTTWQVLPAAWHDLCLYASFHKPPDLEFHPYDPLQQITYALVVFVLTPLTIWTGLAMSPAIANRFPRFTAALGGHQSARSLHFLCMIGYVLFAIIHIALIFLVKFQRNVIHITLGDTDNFPLAVSIFAIGLMFVLVANVFSNFFSVFFARALQLTEEHLLKPIFVGVLGRMSAAQEFKDSDISPYFRVNGRPPETAEYLDLIENDFVNYRLRIYGLVENEIELSIDQLRCLPRKGQITRHVCIQGWTGIAQWAGVPLSFIIEQTKPLESGRCVVFRSYQQDPVGRHYYTSLTLDECKHSQTILAYEMNYKPLTIEHGAPLRLRVEDKLGFTMCKWIHSIEVVANTKEIGHGHGGYREDFQFYETEAQI